MNKIKSKNTGFTLLELLLALGIMGIIAVFALSISHSAKNLARTSETKNRMQEISRTALDHYRGHRDLPGPAGTNEVPVGASAFNLEQKHRLDGWGRYFHYDRPLHTVYPSRTAINGIMVNDRKAAGVLVSGGPDQTLEASNMSSPYASVGDDIVLPISVVEPAVAAALDDLQMLQNKAQAFDRIFAGIDNDGAGGIDEEGCAELLGCPLGSMSNDPNCGSATLDVISSYSACGFAATSPVAFISDFYALGDTILLDPWLNYYVWGDSSYDPSNPRYHKFFSAGPNGIAGDEDDIVP